MPRDTDTRELYEFALEKFGEAPLAKRARLYRALATVIGHEAFATELNELAAQLESAEQRHDQLLLNLRVQNARRRT